MLVFRGSMNFTSHLEVLIAPRAPIDPECNRTLQGYRGGSTEAQRSPVRSYHTEA